MKGIEKFRYDMPHDVTTELLIYQGHRMKTFSDWDSRTAKGAVTRLTKVLKRALKIFDKNYVRPDQRKYHLKKISHTIAAAPSCIIRQLDAFGYGDLKYLVRVASKLEDKDIWISLKIVIWLLEEHEL